MSVKIESSGKYNHYKEDRISCYKSRNAECT